MHGEGAKQCEAMRAGLGWGVVPNTQLLENDVIFVIPSLCGRWCPPGVPDSPFRHCSDPGLGCPASPGRCRVVLGGMSSIPPWGSAAPDTGPLGTWLLG